MVIKLKTEKKLIKAAMCYMVHRKETLTNTIVFSFLLVTKNCLFSNPNILVGALHSDLERKYVAESPGK